MRPEIEAYLREHGGRYTTDALRLQLLLARVVRATRLAFEIHGLGAVLFAVVLVRVYGGLMLGICAASTFATTRGG